MVEYVHERADWTKFRWSGQHIVSKLASVRHNQGRLIGKMQALGFGLRAEAVLQTLTEDVLKSSEIEGENLDRAQVRSSIARRLGMDIGALAAVDRDVEGVVEMMLDATQRHAAPLTKERLFDWHASLFPTGRSGLSKIVVGGWRDDSHGLMQIVSGPIGRDPIHYEAPAADRVNAEMRAFIDWFGADAATLDPVLKAAVAHLWFVTTHPFEDGNGRIARAIADMALARSEKSSQRFYSMSAQIRVERRAYYNILEATQKDDTDITAWLLWFLDCLDRAIAGADDTLASVLQKARFWERHATEPLNERQRLMITRLLNAFQGKLTSSKWAATTKTSQDTAARDIYELVRRGILKKEAAGGRSTSYSLINDATS
jgi:Fic family protein